MSEENNHITDQELRDLLKRQILEADASDEQTDALLDAEAKIAFGSGIVFTPSAEKEEQFLKENKARKSSSKFKIALVIGGIIALLISSIFIYRSARHPVAAPCKKENKIEKKEKIANSVATSAIPAEEIKIDTAAASLNKMPHGQMQLVKVILKENADCNHPIAITDTLVFSPNSPKGTGDELEIKENGADDPMFFENEHNTVWYRFVAQETGQLTFDIIPVNKNDDYDFMLYKFDGGDFRAKVINKKIKPMKACISRNDKRLNSMTGLNLDGSLPSFIHSGEGASYVQYLNVIKGEIYYLLVDNVYGGNGHTIRFHYKIVKPGELFVGQLLPLEKIKFYDHLATFYPGSQEGLKALYQFLVKNPKIRIQIQGHINVENAAYSLSQDRALAIYTVLVDWGIPAARLMHVGYGSTRPVVAKPRNSKEAYLNVRADIKIISLDYEEDLKLSKAYQAARKKE